MTNTHNTPYPPAAPMPQGAAGTPQKNFEAADSG